LSALRAQVMVFSALVSPRADQFPVGGADVAVLHHALHDGVRDVALTGRAVELLQQHEQQIVFVGRLRRQRIPGPAAAP
jgi:hypothetical protein